jgi:hypothetical protein
MSGPGARETSHTVTLIDDETGHRFVLPVLEGTEGPKVIDVQALYKETGFFTYDLFHLRSGLHIHGKLPIGDHLYRRRKGGSPSSRI